MTYEDDLFNTAEEKQEMAEEKRLNAILDSAAEDEPPAMRCEFHTYEFEKDAELIMRIYEHIANIFKHPPIDAWICSGFDPNCRVDIMEIQFEIIVILGVAYINKNDVIKPITKNYYKIKDFVVKTIYDYYVIDVEEIKKMKIYYDVCE